MADSTEVVDLADAAEHHALRSSRLKTTGSQMRRMLPLGEDPAGGDSDENAEIMLGSVRGELRRRARVTDYPFVLRGDTLIANGPLEDRDLWEFLVTLSVRPESRTLPRTSLKPSLEFERLCRDGLASYTAGQAHVFSDLARGIQPAIAELGRRLQVQSYPHHARPVRKDHGLDVVAWRRFRHLTHGVPTVLCQCTVGKPDLVAKACDTRAGEWARLLAVTQESLTTALAVPHVIPPDWDHWFELLGATELVLDRLRLWDLLPAAHRVAVARSDPMQAVLAVMRALPVRGPARPPTAGAAA